MTHQHTYILPSSVILVSLLLAACGGQTAEERAADILKEARYDLQYHRWNAARDSIFSLRRNCPTAIEARRQAILLLDSIEMNAAGDSLRSATGEEWKRLDIKRQFFERKLIEDQKK